MNRGEGSDDFQPENKQNYRENKNNNDADDTEAAAAGDGDDYDNDDGAIKKIMKKRVL